MLDIKLNDKRKRWSFSHPSYNFDSAAGIQYEVDITKKEGDRINIISLADGGTFDMDSKYKVAMTSYRASGGGYHLEQGAGIAKEEMDSRLVARLADIRELLYDQILADGSIEAEKLNQWKFIPQSVVAKLADKDYQLLFE